MAKQLTNLPICVMAVEPEKFVVAVEAGADLKLATLMLLRTGPPL
jgi:hypothetical protein